MRGKASFIIKNRHAQQAAAAFAGARGVGRGLAGFGLVALVGWVASFGLVWVGWLGCVGRLVGLGWLGCVGSVGAGLGWGGGTWTTSMKPVGGER